MKENYKMFNFYKIKDPLELIANNFFKKIDAGTLQVKFPSQHVFWKDFHHPL